MLSAFAESFFVPVSSATFGICKAGAMLNRLSTGHKPMGTDLICWPAAGRVEETQLKAVCTPAVKSVIV